jgi:hypothetical protein
LVPRSNPCGSSDATTGATNHTDIATAAQPAPTNTLPQSNMTCGDWYTVCFFFSLLVVSMLNFTGENRGRLRYRLCRKLDFVGRLSVPESRGEQELHKPSVERCILRSASRQHCNICGLYAHHQSSNHRPAGLILVGEHRPWYSN